MQARNIQIEARYEFKKARRNILFSLFVLVEVVGVLLYVFFPSSNPLRFDFLDYPPIHWLSQALTSSIAFKAAYYFNLVQLVFVIAFVLNDARSLKLNTNEALCVRPQGNADIVTGNFLGKLALFSLVNLIFILCSATVNGLFYPRSFHPWAYLFYWLTLTFPTLVGALGLSFLVQRVTRNQGLGLLLLLVLLGGLTLYGAGWIHGLLDPCARQIPNLFSDFTGHSDTGTYLLQRGFILLAGIAMLILSIIPYRRLPNSTSAKRKYALAATLPAAAAILLAMGFLSTYHHADTARARYRLAYQQHASQPVASIVSHDITISELDGGNIEGRDHLLRGHAPRPLPQPGACRHLHRRQRREYPLRPLRASHLHRPRSRPRRQLYLGH